MKHLHCTSPQFSVTELVTFLLDPGKCHAVGNLFPIFQDGPPPPFVHVPSTCDDNNNSRHLLHDGVLNMLLALNLFYLLLTAPRTVITILILQRKKLMYFEIK